MSFLPRLSLRRNTLAREAGPEIVAVPIESAAMRWRSDTAMPSPDWNALHVPAAALDADLHRFWSGAARAWLEALARALGPNYAIAESAQFMLLSTLQLRERRAALEYAERTRKRVLQLLPGIARAARYGETVILVFDSVQRYYEYIARFYPDSSEHGEFAFSGGMFIDDGYGHFVFVADELARLEPIVAHELTHCLVPHLPLPAWVNEGIAVNTEQRLCPPQGSQFTLEQLRAKHLAFWNELTIQQFWSGKSWLRPDDGNLLSYDLARTFIGLAAREWGAFVAFINAANSADGGDTAAYEHLGYPLAHLAEAVLGEGRWTPAPSCWRDGIERGRFRA